MRKTRFGGRLLLACEDPIRGALSTSVVLYRESGVPGRWAATEAWWQGDILDGEDATDGVAIANWQRNSQPSVADMVRLADGVPDLYDATTRQPRLGCRAVAKRLREVVQSVIASGEAEAAKYGAKANDEEIKIRVQVVVSGVPPEIAKHVAATTGQVVLFGDSGGGLVSAEHDAEAPGSPPRAFYHLPRRYTMEDMKACGLDAGAKINNLIPAKRA